MIELEQEKVCPLKSQFPQDGISTLTMLKKGEENPQFIFVGDCGFRVY